MRRRPHRGNARFRFRRLRRAVHSCFQLRGGSHRTKGRKTLSDKGFGAVEVVDVAGPMMHIEHLAGLGERGELRIITALAFPHRSRRDHDACPWIISIAGPPCRSPRRVFSACRFAEANADHRNSCRAFAAISSAEASCSFCARGPASNTIWYTAAALSVCPRSLYRSATLISARGGACI